MKNLLPHFIVENYVQGILEGSFEAATVLVDISGFTGMTESLMIRGDDRAEVLSSILNNLFTAIVGTIYQRGGFISTFAGDAFTAIFTSAYLHHALFCADKIRHIFQTQGIQKTRFGTFTLEARIGLSFGSVEWGIVGKRERGYFFRGPAIERCVLAERECASGEIVLDARIVDRMPDWFDFRTEECVSGFHRLVNLTLPDSELPDLPRRPRLTTEIASQFLPDSIVNFNQQGEFRNAVSVFISFHGIESKSELDAFVSILIDHCIQFSGYFNKIDYGDKGAVVLVVFGAPISFENNAERALDFILAVKNDVENSPLLSKMTLRSGITYGKVFAGIIGGQERCEYTIIGDIVNQAARFMMAAQDGQIWVTRRINRYVHEQYHLKYLGEFFFKGKTKAVDAYRLIKSRDQRRPFFEGRMIGRQSEFEQLLTFSKPLFQDQFAGIIYIYGEAGMGKSRLAFELIQQLMNLQEIKWFVCPA
ncbi:adenylate/guanylate cyclase domain-containing protein, partial [candidate division CSSED10-310 bacterium]